MTERRWQWFMTTIAVACAVAIPAAARAQAGKLTGVATDKTSGQPVEGVQVHVQGTSYGDITKANGRYFIIGVPPGTYTVSARRIGYQSVDVNDVTVQIDRTREVDFPMNTAAANVGTTVITAQATPLFDPGTVGSSTSITSDVIQALPVTDIGGVLALQQGFIQVPQNTTLISAAEEQRSTIQPVRVRGSRGGSTITLVDGIPVDDPLFGGAAISLSPLAVQSVDFVRGYMEPKYGNALAGVINEATHEGGAQVAGTVDYQTSSAAGALGSTPDELNGYQLLRGYLSGPVPGVSDRLRYAVSGQIESGANRVLQFDNDVFSFNQSTQQFTGALPDELDLIPGWRSFGGRSNHQIVGKLTFLPTASAKINVLAIDQERQTLGYDRARLLTYGDPWASVNNLQDSLGLRNQRNFQDVTQSSVRDATRLYGATLEQRFGRTNLQVRAGQIDFESNTCSFFRGVCVPGTFVLPNFRNNGTLIAPFGVPGVPFPGSGQLSGGENYTSRTIRADLQSQVTDHHNIQLGGSFTRHDITYNALAGIPGNSGVAATVPQIYRAKPIEAATYLQDKIEFDFLTINLGARYDYGRAEGLGFTDPLNPTAGTTAREVCEGAAPGINTTPFTYNAAPDTALTGVLACVNSPHGANGRAILLDSAAKLAAQDDFSEAKARTSFSPRIGVSFPLTERSAIWFNAGRYTMVPLYANLYRNSGIGTVAGPSGGFCAADAVKPGTNECVPPLVSGNPDFVGNPNLLLEQATQYEIGYGAEFARNYGMHVVAYNRNETGLSGLRASRAALDIGTTYSGTSLPDYSTIVNQDFLTSRGIEVTFQRRLSDYWGFDINYGWSKATTNEPPPDRSFEILQGGEIDRTALREVTSEIDQPNRLNATLNLAVRNNLPKFRYAWLLRNTSASFTYQFASGFPYTPVRASTLGQTGSESRAADINTGRAPSTQQVDAIVRKGFQFGGVTYSAFIRASNLFDRKNCIQVFANTGTCESGLRDFLNRRVGNSSITSSTDLDQPEFIGARRSIFTGLAVNF